MGATKDDVLAGLEFVVADGAVVCVERFLVAFDVFAFWWGRCVLEDFYEFLYGEGWNC